MSTITDAAGKFADRIAELLDVFDLSFFVSGAVALGALVWGARLEGLLAAKTDAKGETLAFVDSLSGETIFAAVIMAYALGLVCHAIGRHARRLPGLTNLGRDTGAVVQDAMRYHDLPKRIEAIVDAPRGDPAQPNAAYSHIYTRLWVHIRTEPELKESFALAKRYWILGATFDGLAVAIVPWLWPLSYDASPLRLGLVVVGVVAASIFCVRQALQYREYQAGELVASAAHWEAMERREAEPASPDADDAGPSRTSSNDA